MQPVRKHTPHTVRQWLATIKDNTIRQRAFANIKAKPRRFGYRSQADAILNAFRWPDTPEGVDYWRNVYLEAVKHTL